MKSSKAKLRSSVQETCGVWLDTVQLKQKNKKKQLARPISKLLNPCAEGRGFNLAVALNFTQTKVEMPKTKQSSISTFFTAHRRVLNKMTTSGDSNLGSVEPFLPSAPLTPLSSGRKRGRDLCIGKSDPFPAERVEAQEWKSENAIESQAASKSPSPNMYYESEGDDSEECEPPQSKRRFADSSSVSVSQPPPQAWSQDPLLTWSQSTHSKYDVTDKNSTATQNVSCSEATFLNSLQSEEAFGNLIDAAGRTSTQKAFNYRRSSGMDDDKENSPLFKSPIKSSFSLTNHRCPEPKPASSPKCSDCPRKNSHEERLDFQWTKPKSPLKKRAAQPQSTWDENSLSDLFTQDSQGFRVIAHRGLQARSPLRDQSNVKTQPSVVEDEEEDEEDMLFTQDSQGNLVIKH